MTGSRDLGGIELKPLAIFEGLTIENQDFVGCDLRGVTFVNCIIKNCNFTRSQLSDFDDSEPVNPVSPDDQDAYLKEWKRHFYSIDSASPWRDSSSALKSNSKMVGETEDLDEDTYWEQIERTVDVVSKKRDEVGIEADATHAEDGLLSIKSVFHGSTIEACNFDNMELYGLHFESCELSRTTFRNSNWEFAWLIESSLVDVDVREANLADALLIESKLLRTNAAGANLEDWIVVDCEFEASNFSKSRIDGIEMTDVSLADCDFTNAKFEQIFGRDIEVSGSTNLDLSNLLEPEDEEDGE